MFAPTLESFDEFSALSKQDVLFSTLVDDRFTTDPVPVKTKGVESAAVLAACLNGCRIL